MQNLTDGKLNIILCGNTMSPTLNIQLNDLHIYLPLNFRIPDLSRSHRTYWSPTVTRGTPKGQSVGGGCGFASRFPSHSLSHRRATSIIKLRVSPNCVDFQLNFPFLVSRVYLYII